MHTDFACHLFKRRPHLTSVDIIIREAVVIGWANVPSLDGLPVGLIGTNATLMCRYIEFVADRLLISFANEKIYNVANSFDFMGVISLQGK